MHHRFTARIQPCLLALLAALALFASPLLAQSPGDDSDEATTEAPAEEGASVGEEAPAEAGEIGAVITEGGEREGGEWQGDRPAWSRANPFKQMDAESEVPNVMIEAGRLDTRIGYGIARVRLLNDSDQDKVVWVQVEASTHHLDGTLTMVEKVPLQAQSTRVIDFPLALSWRWSDCGAKALIEEPSVRQQQSRGFGFFGEESGRSSEDRRLIQVAPSFQEAQSAGGYVLTGSRQSVDGLPRHPLHLARIADLWWQDASTLDSSTQDFLERYVRAGGMLMLSCSAEGALAPEHYGLVSHLLGAPLHPQAIADARALAAQDVQAILETQSNLTSNHAWSYAPLPAPELPLGISYSLGQSAQLQDAKVTAAIRRGEIQDDPASIASYRQAIQGDTNAWFGGASDRVLFFPCGSGYITLLLADANSGMTDFESTFLSELTHARRLHSAGWARPALVETTSRFSVLNETTPSQAWVVLATLIVVITLAFVVYWVLRKRSPGMIFVVTPPLTLVFFAVGFLWTNALRATAHEAYVLDLVTLDKSGAGMFTQSLVSRFTIDAEQDLPLPEHASITPLTNESTVMVTQSETGMSYSTPGKLAWTPQNTSVTHTFDQDTFQSGVKLRISNPKPKSITLTNAGSKDLPLVVFFFDRGTSAQLLNPVLVKGLRAGESRRVATAEAAYQTSKVEGQMTNRFGQKMLALEEALAEISPNYLPLALAISEYPGKGEACMVASFPTNSVGPPYTPPPIGISSHALVFIQSEAQQDAPITPALALKDTDCRYLSVLLAPLVVEED